MPAPAVEPTGSLAVNPVTDVETTSRLVPHSGTDVEVVLTLATSAPSDGLCAGSHLGDPRDGPARMPKGKICFRRRELPACLPALESCQNIVHGVKNIQRLRHSRNSAGGLKAMPLPTLTIYRTIAISVSPRAELKSARSRVTIELPAFLMTICLSCNRFTTDRQLARNSLTTTANIRKSL